MSKKQAKSAKTTKLTAKSKTPVLSKAQRSQIAQYAAMKAHLHTTFQSERNREDAKEQKSAFRDYVKTAPAFIRNRYAEDIRETLASLR